MSSENERYLSEDGKGSMEDKLYENSRTDSGFLSGTITSEEIRSENIPSVESEIIEEAEEPKEEKFMRLDSGVDICLSQTFSSLSLDLKDPNLNNLSTTKTRTNENAEKPPEEKHPWELYYRQDEEGDTQLHMAIYHGFLEVVFSLIRLTPHPCLLDIRNDLGQTALHCAAMGGQSRIARQLVAGGACRNARDCAGDTPLHVACRRGDVATARAIVLNVKDEEIKQLGLEYQPANVQADLEVKNYDGEMCVHVAAMAGHVDILRHLEWFGANINAKEGKSGYTPLHIALERRDATMVQFLLEECRQLQVECRTYAGHTAIQLAPRDSPLVQALTNKGASYPQEETDSEDEYDSDSDQMSYESSNLYKAGMVINASA